MNRATCGIRACTFPGLNFFDPSPAEQEQLKRYEQKEKERHDRESMQEVSQTKQINDFSNITTNVH